MTVVLSDAVSAPFAVGLEFNPRAITAAQAATKVLGNRRMINPSGVLADPQI